MKTMKEIKQEVIHRAASAGLKTDCLMDGPRLAEIVIIGDSPSVRDAEMKIPFTGGAGQVLWTALRDAKLTRQHVYTTSVIKRFITYTKGKPNINAAELVQWEEILKWELRQLPNVKYILLLGGFPLRALTGHTGIDNWRGSIFEQTLQFEDDDPRPIHLIAAYSPITVMKQPKKEITFKFDVKGKLNRLMTGKYKRYDIITHINPNYKTALDWLRYIHNKGRNGTPISYDIEVISNETACIGYAVNGYEGYCINFRTMDENVFTNKEEVNIRRAAQKLFLDTENKFVAQNGSFDSGWLWYKDRMHIHKNWFDTLLAHHTLYSQLPHSLGFLTTQYTDHPYYKDEGKNWREGGNIDQFWRYNVKDAVLTWAIEDRLALELKQQKQHDFFFNHVMRLQPHLVRMQVLGILCDAELKGTIAEQLREDVAQLSVDFHNAVHNATGDFDYSPNPGSWQQLRELFFKRLKLIGRGNSTNAENRDRLLKHPRTNALARKVITCVNGYAKEKKFLSTYAEMVVDEDKRIRCEYKQFGTQSAPGRLSSAKTLWGSGMNLQNQPQRAYPMFIADEDYVFVYFDLAQAEARAVGWMANIEKWIEDFEYARLHPGTFDCHKSLAADMFDIPYEDVPDKDRLADDSVTIRYIAKRCRHGLNYRMQADRLASTTGLSPIKAFDAFNKYHMITPELRVWWASLEAEVKTTRMLISPMGRRLIFLERLTDEAMESIVAFKPQSLIGDHVCRVIYQSEDDPKWPRKARMILNIHDALIALVPIRQAEQAAYVMKKYAEQPIMINDRPMIIPADFKFSHADGEGKHRWSTLKDTILCQR